MTANNAATNLSSSSGGHIAVYDGWRGLAVLLVVVGHFFFNPGINIGRFGIEMFFVLSGALMARILFEDNQPIRVFAARRFARIYPALALFSLVMGLVAIASALSGKMPDAVRPIDVMSALAAVFNVVRVHENYFGGRMVNVWSVCVEIHSYIFLAIVAVAVKRRKSAGLAVLVVAALAMWLLGAYLGASGSEENYYTVYWRSEVRMASPLLGAIGYLLAARIPVTSNSALAVACFVAGLVASGDWAPDLIRYTVGTLFLAGSVTILGQPAKGKDFVRQLLCSRFLGFLGTISYSLYLWQYPLLALKPLPFGAIVGLTIALVVSYASYRWFEAPARHGLNMLFSSGRQSQARARSPRERQHSQT